MSLWGYPAMTASSSLPRSWWYSVATLATGGVHKVKACSGRTVSRLNWLAPYHTQSRDRRSRLRGQIQADSPKHLYLFSPWCFGWCVVLLKRHSSIARRPGHTCKHVRCSRLPPHYFRGSIGPIAIAHDLYLGPNLLTISLSKV